MGKIKDEIEELEKENELLQEYRKLLEKALKLEVGAGLKEIKKLVQNQDENSTKKQMETITESEPKKVSAFESNLCEYFSLYNEEDKKKFVDVMCSPSCMKYFVKISEKMSVNSAERRIQSDRPEGGNVDA